MYQSIHIISPVSMNKQKYKLLEHPLFSPHSTASGFWLFTHLKKFIRAKHFCLCLPMSTNVYLSLPICTYAYLCVLMSTYVYLCLPISTCSYVYLPTYVYLMSAYVQLQLRWLHIIFSFLSDTQLLTFITSLS